jgi:hypothetical protein
MKEDVIIPLDDDVTVLNKVKQLDFALKATRYLMR